ncbi:hypothetical protein, conserved [Babesia ovata]|uniref:Uncharacterized protein n=1 Tax=Babesia ovata TaxID=189622 RepID=A0A2H6KJR1_9APIC|nr:uncharacterized protein BOVATA_047270 [Babesia ovata]GBE63234.1 hypothetical protein, conserved [Babesia ovata]
MAFLGGVLSGVREDENVTTYDVKDTNKNITSVINTLNTSVGKGRQAFGVAVHKVSEWLKNHGEQVEGRTQDVLGELGKLTTLISAQIQYLKPESISSLSTIQTIFGQDVGEVMSRMKTLRETEEGFKGLDDSLKEKLNVPLGKIETAVELLKKSSDNLDLTGQVRDVDFQIKSKKEEVLNTIKDKSDALERTTQGKLSEMERRVSAIGDLREEKLEALKKSVESLVASVGRADGAANTLVDAYRSQIVNELGKINGQVKALNTSEVSDDLNKVYESINRQLQVLSQQLEQLGSSGEEVTRGVEGGITQIKNALSEEITQLKGQVRSQISECFTEYVKLVKQSIAGITSAMNDVKATSVVQHDSPLYTKANSVKENLDKLDEQLKIGAGKIGNAIHQDIRDVDDAKELLPSQVKLDLDNVRDKVRNKVFSAIQGLQNSGIGHVNGGQLQATWELHGFKQAIKLAQAEAYQAVSSAIDKIKTSDFDNVFRKLNEQIKSRSNADPNSLQAKIGKIEKDLAPYFTNGVKSSDSEFHLGQFGDYGKKRSEAQQHIEQVLKQIITLEGVQSEITKLDQKLGAALKGSSADLSEVVALDDSVDARVEKVTSVDFNTPLKPLLNDAANKGISMLNNRVTEIHTQLSGIEPEIRPQIDKLQKNSVPNLSGDIQKQIAELQEKITRLQLLVTSTKGSADGEIRTQVIGLRDQVAGLKDSIGNINTNIQAFNKSLQSAIEEAKSTVKKPKQR